MTQYENPNAKKRKIKETKLMSPPREIWDIIFGYTLDGIYPFWNSKWTSVCKQWRSAYHRLVGERIKYLQNDEEACFKRAIRLLAYSSSRYFLFSNITIRIDDGKRIEITVLGVRALGVDVYTTYPSFFSGFDWRETSTYWWAPKMMAGVLGYSDSTTAIGLFFEGVFKIEAQKYIFHRSGITHHAQVDKLLGTSTDASKSIDALKLRERAKSKKFLQSLYLCASPGASDLT